MFWLCSCGSIGCIVPEFTGIQYMNVQKKNGGPRAAKRVGTRNQPSKRGGAQSVDIGYGIRATPKVRSGEYQRQASAAVAYSTGQSSHIPKIEASHDRSRIVHRELIANIVGSSTWTVGTSFALNPGISATFPWLSTQAVGWSQYRFNKLKFCYYTRTASSTPGSVSLVPDYDPADLSPTSEYIASAFEDVQEDVPWKDIECRLRPEAMFPMGPKKYIRFGALASNLDIKTYDAGTLFVGTIDGTAVNWGKIWVEYDVTFHTPQLPPGGAILSSYQHLFAVGAPTSAAIMGTSSYSSTGANLVTVSGKYITFLVPGTFLVVYSATATTSINPSSVIANTGASLNTAYGIGATGYNVAAATTSDSTQMVESILVNVASVGGLLELSNTVTLGLQADMLVTGISPSFS